MHETQNPFIFWLLVALVFVLLYFIVLLIDKIAVQGGGWFAKQWRKHVVNEFPHPEECFDCNRQDCVGCAVLAKEMLRHQ